jgi:RNA-directed DNA polymerase
MPNNRRVALRLAQGLGTAALAGEWSGDEMASRFASALGFRGPRKWIREWTIRIIARFGPDPPRPSLYRLSRFIVGDATFHKVQKRLGDLQEAIWIELPDATASLSLQNLPRPLMAPAAGLRLAADVPSLTTAGELARWLGITPAELDWFADCFGRERQRPAGPLRHYRYWWMSKSCGRKRLLEVPKERLKRIQRRILDEILAAIAPHEAAHAFRAGRSAVSCARPHVGQRVVLRIDLRDFFPSVRSRSVQALFHTLGYPEAVARLLTGLCTNSVPADVLQMAVRSTDARATQTRYEAPHLPQGAPTSPALANLCAYRLDCRLAGLAKRMGINYTRYADDLVFSGDRDFERNLGRFRVFVCAMILDEGFSIRRRKTRVMRSGGRQEITGIVVNQNVNVPRDELDRLKATLHNCVRSGPESQNREHLDRFREHLLGRIAYVEMINAARGERLRTLFNRIDWTGD